MNPPFQVTGTSVSLCGEILRLVGRYESLSQTAPQPMLRRQTRVRTIQGTVAIEGNTLTLGQVAALLDGRRVVGTESEIREVENTIAAYRDAAAYEPSSKRDLLRAHRELLSGLLPDAGRFRKAGVGVFAGARVRHVAPPADRVPALVADLLGYYRAATDVHVLIRSAVLHYELAFIHPFSDGNGRAARFWQHVALRRVARVFEFVPTESVIHTRQHEYYETLKACDQAGESTAFIEFSLQAVHDAIEELLRDVRPTRPDASERLAAAEAHFGSQLFARKEYRALCKTISSATASRDLRRGVDESRLESIGDKALTRYRFRQTCKAAKSL